MTNLTSLKRKTFYLLCCALLWKRKKTQKSWENNEGGFSWESGSANSNNCCETEVMGNPRASDDAICKLKIVQDVKAKYLHIYTLNLTRSTSEFSNKHLPIYKKEMHGVCQKDSDVNDKNNDKWPRSSRKSRINDGEQVIFTIYIITANDNWKITEHWISHFANVHALSSSSPPSPLLCIA